MSESDSIDVQQVIAQAVASANIELQKLKTEGDVKTRNMCEDSDMLPENMTALITIVTTAVLTAVNAYLPALVSATQTANYEQKISVMQSKFQDKLLDAKFDNDRLEQYGRRESIRISGVPEEENEQDDTPINRQKVFDTLKKIDVDVTHDSISAAHRIGKRNYRYVSLPDVQYDADKGIVKQFLRGRPIVYSVPEGLKDKKYKPSGKSRLPNASLKPEWVYGYRGKDCRNNLVYLEPSGELVYFFAGVVILYHVEENTQRCYMEHTDAIKSLAVHPDNTTVATGQTVGTNDDAKAHIRIWNSQTLETLHIIGWDEFQRQISCLAFSHNDGGQCLAVIEDSDPHRTLSLWNWDARPDRQAKIASTRCPEEVLNVSFSKKDSSMFITTGKQSITFHTLRDGVINKRFGVFGGDRPKFVSSCACFDNGQFITGDYNGHLILWKKGENKIERQIKDAHEDTILTILVKEELVYTGGKDGVIKKWNNKLELVHQVKFPSEYGNPRSIACNGPQLFIGTTINDIYQGYITDDTWTALTQGHTEELWALAVHPSKPVFFTGVKTTYLYDATAHTIKWKLEIKEKATSAAFSSTGGLIIIGTDSGKWKCINTETKDIIAEYKDGDKPLEVVKFSPCGQLLAIGSKDKFIYIYEVSKDIKFTKIGKCEGHSSYITHLDWSADSRYIQSNSGDYALLFWLARECKQVITTSEMCEVVWSTHTCVLSLSTLGIWPRGVDGTDINSCARSNSHNHLATGDDFGKVKLFKYPTYNQTALHKVYGGHCSHVTGVNFLHNDTHLITTGGKDTAVIQWALEPCQSVTALVHRSYSAEIQK